MLIDLELSQFFKEVNKQIIEHIFPATLKMLQNSAKSLVSLFARTTITLSRYRPPPALRQRQFSISHQLFKSVNSTSTTLPPDFIDEEESLVSESKLVNVKDPEEVEKFRQDNRISIVRSSITVPDPIFEFAEGIFPEKVKERLLKNGFVKPMPIQAQGWPIAMSGVDMIAIGETGSGKTLGFLLPAFQHVMNQNKASGKPGKILRYIMHIAL